MRESLEFRVWEKRAGDVFPPKEGKRLSELTRQVVLSAGDPRLAKVAELQKSYQAQGTSLFAGWQYHRRYSSEELASAGIFHFVITAVFEPFGELCGTVYDDSAACRCLFREYEAEFQGHKSHHIEYCGAGYRQVTDLFLDLRKAPKSKDIARTHAHEWIVSDRLAKLLKEAQMTGFDLGPVKQEGYWAGDGPIHLNKYPSGRELLRQAEAAGKVYGSGPFYCWLNEPAQTELRRRVRQEQISAKEKAERKQPPRVPGWYQLVVTSPPVPVLPPTRFGINPVDDDPEGRYRCPLGHAPGYALLSELTVSRAGWDNSDFACTREMEGIHRDHFRPHPLLLISPRLWRLLRDNNVKGYKIEIAHLA